jgi:Superfamily II DNA/RNA helicases, SNF2 family
VRLVHLAYQDRCWWLWLEVELPEEEVHSPEAYPFGGDEQDLEEFWRLFWQSEEDGEITESLFWPPRPVEKRSFRLPSQEGKPIPSEFFVGTVEDETVELSDFIVKALPVEASEAVAICESAAKNRRILRGFRGASELLAWHGIFALCNQFVYQGGYLPAVEKNEENWYSCWRPMPSMVEQEWLLAWSQQAPGATLCGFRGTRSELANQVVFGELNRLVREESVQRSNEEKIRQEEAMGNFSPYLQKMIADGTLSMGREKAARKESLHDRWVSSLKSENGLMEITSAEGERLSEEIYQWQERFFHWRSAPLRVALSLSEPEERGLWPVTYWLQSAAEPENRIALSQLWKGKKEPNLPGLTWEGSIREWTLTTLGAGALISSKVNFSLRSASPEGFTLTTSEVVPFLEKEMPRLLENGFVFLLPEGWQGSRKLSLRAQGKIQPMVLPNTGTPQAFSLSWNLSLDGEPLTPDEIHNLLESQEELIEFRGRWVQVDQGEVQKLLAQWKKQPEKTLSVAEALQMGLAGEFSDGPMLDSLEMDDSLEKWIEAIIHRKFEELPVPEEIRGVLRPYQVRGFSWLAFLSQFSLGGCLADDMGLGKTIQAIAFLAHLRKTEEEKPFLLVCPTSLLGNWYRELQKFWPEAPLYIYHGTARKAEEFHEAVERSSIILTTYSLLSRDEELICSIPWGAAVLDEAQNIKNPMTRQAQAARTIKAQARIALTGTPVENHAGDLWSILQFLNPGILPNWGRFQREFLRPIQEEQNEEQLERLRRIASPFLLRRLKSDPTIAPDLPEKEVFKVICSLGTKQAQLYRKILAEAEQGLKEAKGMVRRGLILATLTKLKQDCAHPCLVEDSWGAKRADSGKLQRLEEMIDEVVDSGGKALVFTQFIEMGRKIRSTLSDRLGKPVLFYHGGLSRTDRDALIDRFQKDENIPVLVLSLRAGGTGLNLTAASHVFHYDRWWNPAVEDQATDRAHRIGQEKDVQVIHLICGGTLEERINDLIERKRSVASGLVESGEAWLTELSGQELSKLWQLDEEREEMT